jgi:alanyl aminopeptidase
VLARDPDRHVVDASTRVVAQLEPLVPDDLVPRFEAFVREAYGGRARELGWSAQPGESEDVRLLRKSVIAVTARFGHDRALEREGIALAQRWLDDASSADPDLVTTILAAAAGAGNRDLFERLRGELVRTGDRDQRDRLLEGLGAVRDPGLAGEAAAITLDERVDARESVQILWSLASRRETRRAAFDYLTRHYDALAARLPSTGAFTPVMYFPWLGADLCNESARKEIDAFFKERSARVVGGPRELAQALESLDQCVAREKFHRTSVSAFLEARPAS